MTEPISSTQSAAAPDAVLRLALDPHIDVRATLAAVAHGHGDPTIRFRADGIWRAWRTPDGPATLQLRLDRAALTATAWGPGAQAALAALPGLVGATDEPARLRPRHPLIADLVHRLRGLRLARTDAPWEALLPAICEQKVTGAAAREAYRGIVRAYGEPAPGPAGLWLAPDPLVLAGLPYFAFHRFGIERRRADVIRRAAAAMPRLAGREPEVVARHLLRIPGIGPWTMAEVARVAWGDPDAVSVGDYHLPNLVAWALAGEPRANDARMLELLEPYRGQRGRVQLVLEAAGISPPRYGPRMAPHRIQEL